MKSMKKSLTFAFALAALLCLLMLSVSAYDGTHYGNTGIFYKISNGEATITDVGVGVKSIPESINGYPVTSIGDYAFSDCTYIKSITIPNSVTNIGYEAFSGCTGLTSITIGNSVTCIGDYAFSGCIGLTSITIPNSVTSVGSSAFKGCTELTRATIGNSVTSMGYYTFEDCTGLTSITIPNSVTSIGFETFSGCISLASITIGNGVTSIDNRAFSGCSSLKSIKIPNSVTSIGYEAFDACGNLKNITIPDSVTSIDSSALDDTAWYRSQSYGDVYAGKVYYKYKGTMPINTSITIKDGTKGIAGAAFYDCTGLKNITIPGSITSIVDSAFSGCTGLAGVYISDLAAWCSIEFGSNPLYYANNLYLNKKRITDLVIPDSVTNIVDYAFKGCDFISSVTIPDSVTSIGTFAFEDCTSLTSITIPNSVKNIGSNVFDGCTGLTKINWNAESVEYFNDGREVFQDAGTSGTGIDVVFGDKVKNIPESLFDYYYYPPKIKSVTIGNSVTTIGKYAFKGCTGLTGITIPSSVTRIGEDAFKGCTGLAGVYISDLAAWCSIKFDSSDSNPLSYANNLYLNKNRITDLVIPNSVMSIGSFVFKGFTSLTNITIPSSVTKIGYETFRGCTGLKKITIPNSVTSIGNESFYGCTGLTSIIISNAVTNIGDYVFVGCNSLTNITIPNGVTNIGICAFGGCTSLTSIAIPDSVTSIGYDAFYNCTSLTSITIPNSVASIVYETFRGCTSLTSITIPDNVTSIGYGAFYDCTSLTSITIPNSVTSIDNYAFYNCTKLTTIKIGKCLKSIGYGAFGGIKVVPEIYYAGSKEEWKNISIDSSNDLFLRANMHYNADISHKHSYTETITKKATCTETGTKTFTCDCGRAYTETIPATGHKYVTETQKATCTSIGVSIKKCKSCGIIASATTTPAKGHTEVTDAAVPATCTEKGKTEGKHCSVCGEVLVAQKATKALGHKNKTTLIKATTSKDGKIVTSCTVCKTVSKTTVISRASSVKLAKTSYTYNGKAQKPKVTVKDSKGKLLTEGKDYTVKYQSGRKNPGKYTVTVTFKGNYSGKKTLTFTIAPKAPTLKASAAKKSAKLSWNKKTGASGYTVYMATSKNGKYKKIATVKGNKVSYTKTGLTKGKTYYFKVAAYTTSGGKTISGAYSKVKSVKVK